MLPGGRWAWSRAMGRDLWLGAGPQSGCRSLTVIQAQCSVDEGGRSVKEDAEVKGGQVVGLDTMVLDGHVPVVVRPCVHVPAAMGRVQHVREACLLQPVAVQRR